ncbi:integrase [Sphingopyxis sp. OAS728]|nr:integrase [Sphingopyxis sp. OAS728]
MTALRTRRGFLGGATTIPLSPGEQREVTLKTSERYNSSRSETGRPVQFEIMSEARGSLLAWIERRGGSIEDFAFPGRVDHSAHMSTRQYARLVDEWVTAVGLRSEDYGTHLLRRTKPSIIYKATGNLRAVQILLGHTKIENTVRYLGVDVEDALTLAEGIEV